jgi:hypothetical protein
MNEACRQLSDWLDADRTAPLDPALAAHAAACEACARQLAIDQALRTGLAAGAAPEAARLRALADRIAPRRAVVAATRRSRRWPWFAGAAAVAAAVVLSLTIFRPEQRQPVSPTELFGDLFGPLADLTPPPTQAAAPAVTHPSPLGPVLAALWGDFEAPLDVGLGAVAPPQPAASADSAAAPAPSSPSPAAKKEG